MFFIINLFTRQCPPHNGCVSSTDTCQILSHFRSCKWETFLRTRLSPWWPPPTTPLSRTLVFGQCLVSIPFSSAETCMHNGCTVCVISLLLSLLLSVIFCILIWWNHFSFFHLNHNENKTVWSFECTSYNTQRQLHTQAHTCRCKSSIYHHFPTNLGELEVETVPKPSGVFGQANSFDADTRAHSKNFRHKLWLNVFCCLTFRSYCCTCFGYVRVASSSLYQLSPPRLALFNLLAKEFRGSL